jgi:hypothetical protein
MEVGNKIESNTRNENEWLIGEIISANENETYDVKFDNDEIEKDVSVSNIRTIEASSDDYSPMNEILDYFEEGSKVEIDKDGDDNWMIGTIINHNRPDATYDVIYEKSKEFGTHVTANRIRFVSDNAEQDSDEEDEPIETVITNDETAVEIAPVLDSNNDTISSLGGDSSPKDSKRKESRRSKRSASRSRSPSKDRKSDRHSKKRSSRDRSRSRDRDSREGRGERSRERGRDRSEGRERRRSFDEKKGAIYVECLLTMLARSQTTSCLFLFKTFSNLL